MKKKRWERLQEGIWLEVQYDDRDILDTPDGPCYVVKSWHVKCANIVGAGFTSDDNIRIIVMRGDNRYDSQLKVYATQL